MSLVLTTCDKGKTLSINYNTAEVKIIDVAGSYIARLSIDKDRKLVMIGGSYDSSFRIYDLKKEEG